jgi:hypothetical protein
MIFRKSEQTRKEPSVAILLRAVVAMTITTAAMKAAIKLVSAADGAPEAA